MPSCRKLIKYANVAQQVEQLTRNEQVARSNRVISSKVSCFQETFLCSLVIICQRRLST